MDKELLEMALKRSWKEESICELLSEESSPGVAKNQNFLSEVKRIEMKVVLGNGRVARRSVIVKDCKATGEKYNKFQTYYNIYKIETMMYKRVVHEMENLMEEFGDTDDVLWCKLIHCFPYTMILEDLKPSGFSLLERHVYFDLEHSLLGVHSLGRYHGMCKILEARGLVSREGIKPWYVYNDKDVHNLWSWHHKAVLQGMKKHWGDSWGSVVDRITVKMTDDFVHEKLKKCGEVDESRFNVLNHGDCQKNNIMFKYDWNKKPIGIRFLDYQMPHYNTPCSDLTLMLFFGTEPSLRREHFDRFVEVYHKSLVRTLEKFQYGGSKPTLQDIYDDIEMINFANYYLLLFGYFHIFLPVDMDSFYDIDKLCVTAGKEGYDIDILKDEWAQKAYGPDLKTFVDMFF